MFERQNEKFSKALIINKRQKNVPNEVSSTYFLKNLNQKSILYTGFFNFDTIVNTTKSKNSDSQG